MEVKRLIEGIPLIIIIGILYFLIIINYVQILLFYYVSEKAAVRFAIKTGFNSECDFNKESKYYVLTKKQK